MTPEDQEEVARIVRSYLVYAVGLLLAGGVLGHLLARGCS